MSMGIKANISADPSKDTKTSEPADKVQSDFTTGISKDTKANITSDPPKVCWTMLIEIMTFNADSRLSDYHQ